MLRQTIYFASYLVVLVYFATSGAQSPASAATPSPAEVQYAVEIAALPQDQALARIAAEDSSRLTEGAATALKNIGQKTAATELHKAAELYGESGAMAERAALPQLASDLRRLQAQMLSDLGMLPESLTADEQALHDLELAKAPPSRSALVDLAKSAAELKLGDTAGALADAQTAQRVFTDSGDPVGIARAENALGNAYVAIGSYREAVEALDEALRLARAQNQKRGESYVLNNLSMVYSSQGDYSLAARYCEQSLAIKRANGDSGDISTSLINLGNIYHHAGRDADAIAALKESIDLGQKSNRPGSIAGATAELGIIELDNHHDQQAIEYLKQGLQLSEQVGERRGSEVNLYELSAAYLDMHDYAQAIHYATDAANESRQMGLPGSLSDATMSLGRSELVAGHPADARRAFEETIATIEQIRGNVAGGIQERRLFLEQRTDPYRYVVDIAAGQGDWTSALQMADRAKGRVLLDLYSGGGSDVDSTLTAAEREHEARLREKLISLDAQYSQVAAAPNPSKARLRELDSARATANVDAAAFRSEIYAKYPRLRLRRADIAPITAADLAELILSPANALLEYEVTPTTVYLFVITRGSPAPAIHGYRLSITPDQLTQQVSRYHSQLASRDPDFSSTAKALYASLLAPARAQLAGVTSLILVPDGVLWRLPFQALQRLDGTFVVEHAAVAYTPSLSVLRELRKSAAPKKTGWTLLALGDPRGETPEQATEATALKTLYGVKRSELYLGNDVSLDKFRARSGSFDVVHVAAHGTFDDKDPMSSHLILASSTRETDGWLQARDLEGMQLHAQLVVLSGCETAEGTFQDGEGLVGMSWAALAAGARAALASQWRVEANSTTQLMLAFHSRVLQGEGKSLALRHSELKLIHSEQYVHPFYWAGFVLMGDGD